MSVIKLTDVSYHRGDREILSGISWNIQRGQHWALVGSNGSGKTTLLKIITGYEWSTTGEVEVLGKRFGQYDLRELRKTIGWVSSALEHNIPGHNTALEIVASGIEATLGLYRDYSPAEFERARETIHLLGGVGIENQLYTTLSQGEQQRILIARALISRPELLILDEPCAGLDPAARDAFLTDLGQLAERHQKPTIILVTHHIEEIGPWIDRVCVLKAGRILASGPKSDLLNDNVLSNTFDCRCCVESLDGHYYLRILRSKK